MNPHVPANTEAELESFRQQWRQEVTARTKGKASGAPPSARAVASTSKPLSARSTAPDALTHAHRRPSSIDDVDEAAPYVYHDLGEKQSGRRLDEPRPRTAAALAASREPTSALDHYEKAVEKESQGSLGDSVNLYRKAFRVSVGSEV